MKTMCLRNFLLAVSFFSFVSGYSQLTAIEIDTVIVHTGLTADGVDLTGYTTYRLYAVCQNENDIVTGMVGQTNITAGGSLFWHSPAGASNSSQFGGVFASDISCTELSTLESVNYDSWLTVNAESGCNTNAQLVGSDCGGLYGNWVNGFISQGFVNFFSSWEGCNGWYYTNSNTIGIAGPSHRVLLGQFTTQGVIYANVTVIVSENGDTANAQYETACAVSDATIIQGCMDSNACNFNPLATWDNCTCSYPGCTNVNACNYNPNAMCDDGSCLYGDVGCTSMNACNYSPWVTCSDYSYCTFPGCTDPAACNYDATAGCDDGTCNLPYFVKGYVFYDPTPNISWDNSPSSNGMSGVTIHLLPEDIYAITDLNGYFEFSSVPDGDHSVQVELPSGNFMFVEDGYNEFTTPLCSYQYYGITSTSGGPWAVTTNFNPFNLIHCTNGANAGFWLHNTGTGDVQGQLTVHGNPNLVFLQGTNEMAVEAIEITDSTVIWTFPFFQPGDEILLQTFIEGPGTNLVGQYVPLDYELLLIDAMGVIVSDSLWTDSLKVVCAYDPNVKSANPEGYTEEHFILQGEFIQYTVEFQNTGNYPADLVVVEDEIDVAELDISTFEFLGASHNVYTQIQNDGLVRFVFENIQLPDSSSNEPESHGYLQYRIALKNDALPGAEILNTASIFFDANPAVITNTTSHHVFDCNWIGLQEDTLQVCYGWLYWAADCIYPPDTYSWFLDGISLDVQNDSLNMDVQEGFHELELITTNSLCSVSSSAVLTVDINTIMPVYFDGLTITAESGYFYQWYVDGALVPDDHDQILDVWSVANDGSQIYATVIGPNGCEFMTEQIIVSNVGHFEKGSIKIFPNPANSEITIIIPDNSASMRWIDSSGKLLMDERVFSNMIRKDLSELVDGVYQVQFVFDDGKILNQRVCVAK